MEEINLTKEYLETILEGYERKKTMTKIEEVFVNSAVESGNNFLGEVMRVKLNVVMGDGTQCKKSIIVKLAPSSKTMRKFVMDKGAFVNETRMYTEVLPNMARLLQASREYIEPLWPDCISNRTYDTIVLQDLTALGYRMLDRLKFLDLDTSIFVIQALARFHAASVVAKEKYLLDPLDFGKYWFGERNEVMEQVFQRSIKSLAQVIKKNWGKEWQELGEDIDILGDTLVPRLGKAATIIKSEFNVLNHADLKTPNMMFKYCSSTGKLIGVRFLDYQCVSYGSFAIDLQFFLYNSVDPDVREKYYNSLLEAYHDSLIKTFHNLEYESTEIPSLNHIRNEMEKHCFIGVATGCMMLPLTLVDKDDSLALEDAIGAGDDFNTKTFTSSTYNETMQKLLRPFLNSKILKMYLD